jgi:hypothetical protein
MIGEHVSPVKAESKVKILVAIAAGGVIMG